MKKFDDMKKIDWILAMGLVALSGVLIYTISGFFDVYINVSRNFSHNEISVLMGTYTIMAIIEFIGILIILALICIDEDAILIRKLIEFHKEYDKNKYNKLRD